MNNVRIAITKGRLEKYTMDIFEAVGIDCSEIRAKGRKLIFKDTKNSLEFVLAKASDVLTYVEHGVVDIGIVGKDTLMEEDREFYEVVDLKVGKCRFAVASLPNREMSNSYKRKIIASKYPTVAQNYFKEKGEDVEIIKIDGSVELAPILGLADAIVDIVETGTTLKENGLIIIDEICSISARMIVNRASMKINKDFIGELIKRIQKYIDESKEIS